jgi:hypothetical protein
MVPRTREVKKRGRPRIHDTGATRTATQLAPDTLRAVLKLAKAEKRSASATMALLIEEALMARGSRDL